MNTFKNLISLRFARLNKNGYSLFLLLLSMLTLNLFAVSSASAQTPTATDFQRTLVASSLDLPMEFEISKDGRVFVVSKCGKFYGWNLNGGSATQTALVPNVRCVFEDGLLSIALDPNFTTNNWVYLQYTSPGSKTRVSRFTVTANNGLDPASEKIVLEWITGNEANGHMGGSLKFDKNGNLLITTGDNTAASGYFAAGPQATSGNTNDLRGKVLRITPTAAGGYTIPAGNLFPADSTHRAEIYGMGFRNPFRINIDPLTNYYYVGDIGPDASAASAEGPMGLDELNELKEPGNYGWPYIIGYNQPYAGYNPTNITNNYATNTGAKTLPAAKPALWTIMHRATMSGPVYRFNSAITNEFKLPAYYDGRLIYWDFNSSKFFTIKLAGASNPPVAEDFPLNTSNFQGAIDAELDPTTQQLYVLQWGSGCCDKEPFNNGALYRFDYIGDRDNGPNLGLGAIVIGPSVGGNLPSYIADGNATTRWESAVADPQVLNIDLRTDTTISSIVIKWEAAFSSKYTVEGSLTANGPWDMLVNEQAGAGATELKMINTTKKYRYLRYTGLARGTAYGHSIFEFEVYGGSTPEPDPLTEFAYLNMPKALDASFTGVPKLLSQTGAFSNTANLTPIANMVPFTPISQLWSDRATKARWISIPKTKKINWSAKDNWTYPQGTVSVKQFDLPVDARNAAITKRVETRLIVTKADGSVYGVTYKWRADNSDADLLTTSATQNFTVTNADSTTSTQIWTYPSPTDCFSCHTADSSKILGLSTRQLNSNYTYPGGVTENQLVHFNNLALFTPALNNAQVGTYDKLAALADTSATLEKRVKSYLDANCAHCHGTGNGGSQWDARFNTPLDQMKTINVLTTGIRDYQADYGIAAAKVIATGKPLESILYIRDKSINPNDRMPPLGRALEHTEYISVLNEWITSLSGAVPPTEKVLLSKGKTITVSTFEGDLTGNKAVDGDPTTRWGSAFADPQTIEIDLQAAYNISEIMLQWEAAFGKVYKIEGSLDRATWTNMVTQNNGTGGIEIHDKVTGKYQYIRLTGTTRGTAYGYSLFEFEVWGSTGVVGTPTPTLTVSSPTAGQQYNQGTAVSLQVAVSDTTWFTAGNSYRYTLDNGAAVTLTNGNAVNLGTPAVGTHNLSLQLLKAGAAVGTAVTRSFTVNALASGPISVGKLVTSSLPVTGTNVAENAVDNNPNTRWESAFADNQFIQIDLGSKMNISQVVLNWEGAYGKGYNIQVSDTGAAPWTQLYTTTTGDGGLDTLTVSGQGRFVRLNCVTRGTVWGFSLWEFTVMGSPIGNSTPTIAITAPTANQSFTAGTAVNLQVAVSDAAWFTAGNSYTYKLDTGTAVKATNANAVNLGTQAVGTHTVTATLYNAANTAVGTAVTTTFSVVAAGTPTISITTPTANQEYNQGTNVSLQVAVSDAAWFSAGNSYSYKLDTGTAVKVTNANAVNLGAPAVGTHTVTATLYNAANAVVGTTASRTFIVKTGGTTPVTPSPAKLTSVLTTASTFVGGNTAAAGTDGNTATRWESATADPQYLQLNMGKSMYFTKVVLNWEPAYAKAYTIDVSENGTDWTNAYTTTTGTGGIETLTLDGQRGQYIRMRGTVRATAYGYSLFEFDAYGIAADTNPALISFVAPAADAVIAKTTAVSLQVAISDTSWVPNGSYNYYLDYNAPVKVNNLNAINLGLLATGPHTLKVSLVNSSGVEVSVPKTRKFRVSCGTNCPSVLVFSKTAGFRHDSIAAGIAMVQKIATENGYTIAASEDASLFTTANLAKYSTVVFMNTTGDIFDANQKAAFQAYIENGGGWVGTHSAADTEHNWPWYTGTLLAGGEFINHNDGIPRAKVKIEQTTNGLVNHIGTEWWIADEWYFWKNNPRNVATVTVLGNLDRSSYPSNSPVADHPVIYTNTIGQGRTFYTAVGHVDANFSDPNMTEMIRKAIEWTSKK